MTIGVCYPEKYPVEEFFQLLKVPWEWYVPGKAYDVVIARKADVPDYRGPLIDLNEDDIFQKIGDLLNRGQEHLQEPLCDIEVDRIRNELKTHTLLVEIPPVPWGYSYCVALTHDVDVTSVRECRWKTVGYAAYQCLLQGQILPGIRIITARLGLGKDLWSLFERWNAFEQDLGVRSTFFFVPKKGDTGRCAHPYRSVSYHPDKKCIQSLNESGWETGIHGIDNWIDAEEGKREREVLGIVKPGNRTHWLLFDPNSWQKLDEAGYSYDSTFGYNDDAGFRAGTLQVYRPRSVKDLLELPLHIQDLGLFGKFCWVPTDHGWERTSCLHLSEPDARVRCDRIFEYVRKYGGVVTLLWHYENLVPPRDWSALYQDLILQAKSDGAWVTTAGEVVEWFRARRVIGITCIDNGDVITLDLSTDLRPSGVLPYRLRLYISPDRIHSVNTEFITGPGYIDIFPSKPQIVVHVT